MSAWSERSPRRDLAYPDRIEAIAERYGGRIMALLEQARTVVHDCGYETVEFMVHDDNFRWVFTTEVGDGSLDFIIFIAQRREYDGQDAEPGIYFGLDIKYGCLIVGGFTPYNHTDRVWVDAYDDTAVEERFVEFESGASAVVKLIDKLSNAPTTQPRKQTT